jgi:hypothetical protein
MKKGIVISRIDGNVLIQTWDSKEKTFTAPNLITNLILHTEDDFIEALQLYKNAPQGIKIYFLTN